MYWFLKKDNVLFHTKPSENWLIKKAVIRTTNRQILNDVGVIFSRGKKTQKNEVATLNHTLPIHHRF